MKIKNLAIITTAAFLALAANGQGTGAAGARTGTGTGTSGTAGANGTAGTATGNGSINNGAAVNNGGINTGAAVPAQPGTVSPGTVPGTVIQNPNGNTPVVGASAGANNSGMATNNLGLGTNQLGIGQNQFQIRSNNNGAAVPTTPLTPTGTNSNRILLNP